MTASNSRILLIVGLAMVILLLIMLVGAGAITQLPIAHLNPDLPVSIREHWGDWAEIVCENNWTGWVDSRHLIPGP